MEQKLHEIEEEMPIPNENVKNTSCNVPNSKLDEKVYSNHK